jgi:hypothetical protein
MDTNPLVQILSVFVEGKPSISKVDQLPPDAAPAFSAWANQNNLPLDDSDTEVDFYAITFPSSGVQSAYFADVSGDDPDPFHCCAAIQGGKIIGEWGMFGD